MVGLLVLGVIVGWVALWLYVFKKARNRGERVVAVVAAIAIPFWDLPFGYLHFRTSCSTEGGLRVLGKISPQSAICTEKSFGDAPQFLMEKGFNVVEFRAPEKTIRYKRTTAGQIEASTVSTLLSQYCLGIEQDQKPEWNTYRRDLIVREMESKTIVARFTSFDWQGTWLKPKSMPSKGAQCFPLKGDELIALVRGGTSK